MKGLAGMEGGQGPWWVRARLCCQAVWVLVLAPSLLLCGHLKVCSLSETQLPSDKMWVLRSLLYKRVMRVK